VPACALSLEVERYRHDRCGVTIYREGKQVQYSTVASFSTCALAAPAMHPPLSTLESSELSMNLHASVTPHTLLLAVYLIGEGEGAQNELMPVVGSKENSFKHG